MKIWGRTNSTNVKKVLWMAEELGLTYERIDAGGAFGVVDDPAFRAMNPNGLVPVLQDGDVTLWESNTIVRYLADAHGGERFGFASVAARAGADKWMDWTSGTVAVLMVQIIVGYVRTAPEKRDMEKIKAVTETLGQKLALANAALEDQPFLSGANLGMGDIPLGCFIYPWFELPLERPDLPALAAWYERLKQRPAYQTTVMIPLT